MRVKRSEIPVSGPYKNHRQVVISYVKDTHKLMSARGFYAIKGTLIDFCGSEYKVNYYTFGN